MAKKKKHSTVEIASKLAQANDLATQGKLQSEIARTLGVSVMTPVAQGCDLQWSQVELAKITSWNCSPVRRWEPSPGAAALSCDFRTFQVYPKDLRGASGTC
jgi:hypothetical protein